MATKIHLHANLPHDIDKPNIALGYLKSFLSQENVDVTNIYWYLMPMEKQENSNPVYLGVQVILPEGAEKRVFPPQSCTCSGGPLLNPKAYKKVVRKSNSSCTPEDAAHR